ncbi:MAG: DNA-binding protein [Anaerovoracaceae bacterium]
MDYMTIKEAGKKWGVTPRWINYYCVAGRIPGAVKMATIWLIPKDAVKPADRRRKKRGDGCGKDCDM